MKFKVGDRVNILIEKNRGTGKITKIDEECTEEPPMPYLVAPDNDGYQWWCREDELELVQPETQEPIPGKYYRTGDGRKLLYIGKQIKGYYLYQSLDGGLHTYTRANLSGDKNIVGEWVDEVVLPAVEIKRYYIVTAESTQDTPRGTIIGLHNELRGAQRDVKILSHRKLEIVELVGILPERKVSK